MCLPVHSIIAAPRKKLKVARNAKIRTAASPEPGIGFIEPGVLYRIDEAKRRLGWEETALRTARGKGLKVMYLGNRAYVRGEALIEYIERNSKSQHRSVDT